MTKPHSTPKNAFAWLERIDAPIVVRGASTGFSVLIVGGLLQPIVARTLPALGAVWLPIVAVAAFAVAARRIGRSQLPAAAGAVAALSSYLLALPLVLLAPQGRDPVPIVATAALAVVTGAVVGFLQGRRRIRRGTDT